MTKLYTIFALLCLSFGLLAQEESEQDRNPRSSSALVKSTGLTPPLDHTDLQVQEIEQNKIDRASADQVASTEKERLAAKSSLFDICMHTLKQLALWKYPPTP